MVNNPNLRIIEILVAPKSLTDSNRKIHGGPLYNLDVVKTLVSNFGLFVINEDARNDATNEFSPPMDEEELKAIIYALRSELFNKSEWVLTSARSTVACDSYTIRWNRNKRIEWEHGNKIYIKFGFRPNSDRCLVMSIHYARY